MSIAPLTASPRALRIAPALTLLLLLLPSSGCKTRPYELEGEDDVPGFDGAADGPRDLAAPINGCGAHTIQTTQVVRADLLLIQDRSRSMTQRVNGQPKWDLVRTAIAQVVAGTPSVDWGLMLFGADSRCNAPLAPEVPVAPGAAAVIPKVLAAASANASTPTTATIKNALAWFQNLKDDHPHYMLLATDGQPACPNGPGGSNGDDSVAAIQAVATAAAAGVPTFVVGIGSTDGAQQTLAAMARAGQVMNNTPGQPAYYPVTNTQDLVNVLEKAALRITPCSYPLVDQPPDREQVTMEGPDGLIPRDLLHQDGWDYSQDGGRVVFFGPACEALQRGVVASVQAIYGCQDR